MKALLKVFSAWQQCNLMLRILMGIIIGSVLALTLPDQAVVSMLGDLFVGALKGIAPVLVFVLVAASVSKARNGLGSRFKSVVILYLLSTLVAAVVAVLSKSDRSETHALH